MWGGDPGGSPARPPGGCASRFTSYPGWGRGAREQWSVVAGRRERRWAGALEWAITSAPTPPHPPHTPFPPGGRRRSRAGRVEWAEVASPGERGRAARGVAPESTGFLRGPPASIAAAAHALLLFLPDNVPFWVVSRLRRRWLRRRLLRMLRKAGALESPEVWAMGKEVGLWEAPAPPAWPALPSRALHRGNGLGGFLLPSRRPELLESAADKTEGISVEMNGAANVGQFSFPRCMVHFYKRQVKRLRIKMLFHIFKETSV